MRPSFEASSAHQQVPSPGNRGSNARDGRAIIPTLPHSPSGPSPHPTLPSGYTESMPKEKILLVNCSRNCTSFVRTSVTLGLFFATSNCFDSDFSSLSEALTLAQGLRALGVLADIYPWRGKTGSKHRLLVAKMGGSLSGFASIS